MRTQLLPAVVLAAALAVPGGGCRRNNVAKAPPPAATYARPTTSPIVTPDTARRFKTYFPAGAEDKFDDHGGNTTESNDNLRPQMFTFGVGEDFTLSKSTLDECETAANLYVADLSKTCAELGGSMTAGKVERAAGGFTVSSTYVLPQRKGTVKITVTPRTERCAECKRVTVSIVEEAEGQQTPP